MPSYSGLQGPGESRAGGKSEESPRHGPRLHMWVLGRAGLMLIKAVTPLVVLLWVIHRRRRCTRIP